jgi:hypothetical protein
MQNQFVEITTTRHTKVVEVLLKANADMEVSTISQTQVDDSG